MEIKGWATSSPSSASHFSASRALRSAGRRCPPSLAPTIKWRCDIGALFSSPKSPTPPPPPPPQASPPALAQAANSVAARSLSTTEQLFGGTIQNQGGAQGQDTSTNAKRSLLG